jgi:hypothetical protein
MLTKARFCREKIQESVSGRHPPPLIDEFAEDVADRLADQFWSDDMGAKLRALVRHRNEISPTVRLLLIKELKALAARATEFANDLAQDANVLATLQIMELVDEDQSAHDPNEGDLLTFAESHETADVVARGNGHSRPSAPATATARLLKSRAEATSRNSARNSS